MFVLLQSDLAWECKDLEKFLISYLRRKIEECTSHDRPTIANIIPGGEGSMRRFAPPYFTYMVVGSGSRLGQIRLARERWARKRRREATTGTN